MYCCNAMTDFVVASTVRNEINSNSYKTASDAIEVLDDFIAWLIDNASVRAEQNGRKTVRAHDFVATPVEDLDRSFVVSSRVKDRINGMGFNASSDAINGLNTYITWKIDAACRRAESNGRKTIRGHDFMA